MTTPSSGVGRIRALRGAIAAALAVGLAAGLALPAGSRASGGVSLLTPSDALRALSVIWPERESALHNNRIGALDRLDAGGARDHDVGLTLYAKGLGTRLGRRYRLLGSPFLIVPEQVRFPISFLAIVQTSGQYAPPPGTVVTGDAIDLVILTKSTPTAAWRVALESSGTGEPFAGGSQAPGAYAPPAPVGRWECAVCALRALARFDQRAVEQGQPPSPTVFAPGLWTTGEYSAIANEGVNGPTDGGGVIHRHTYVVSAASDGVFHYSVFGVDLACGTIRVRGVVTPANPKDVLVQPPDRLSWGGWLRPGIYRMLHTFELEQVCLSIAPTAAGGIAVVGGDAGLDEWSVTGSPA